MKVNICSALTHPEKFADLELNSILCRIGKENLLFISGPVFFVFGWIHGLYNKGTDNERLSSSHPCPSFLDIDFPNN